MSLLHSTTALILVLSVFANEQLPQILRYEDSIPDGRFVPLKRLRREVDPDDPLNWHIPDDYEKEDSGDKLYYVMNVTTGKATLEEHFVDIDEMLKKKNVKGNSSHPLLSSSYRRAVGAKLTFEFPFYGHKMYNLTIATGGFIYIGDQTHNWLAATQYIAPLMANFDTHLEDSNIIYADDGEKFVVEWRKVQLREQSEDGPFTFQVSLHKNGDIVFAYKDVPMDVSNISDSRHPVKLGISDAYLYNHVPKNGAQATIMPKRVIYEYHRIEVHPYQIQSNTVVYLIAQPTCISLSSCEACANVTLKYFNCSWCRNPKSEGGSFCTDEAGMHRKRQTFMKGNCKEQKKHIYCGNGDEDDEHLDDVVNLVKHKKASKFGKKTSGGGIAFVIFCLGLALCGIAWVAYAYYNPHTSSGQLLIKYRPSRWSMPSSHVRYSASVHM